LASVLGGGSCLAIAHIAALAPCTLVVPVMKAIAALALVLATRSAGAVELTQEDWDEKTAGKSVFVKFLAPW